MSDLGVDDDAGLPSAGVERATSSAVDDSEEPAGLQVFMRVTQEGTPTAMFVCSSARR